MKKKLFIVFLLVGLTAGAAQAANVGEGPMDSFLTKVGRFFGLKPADPPDRGQSIAVGIYANSTSRGAGSACACSNNVGGPESTPSGIMAVDEQGGLFCCCPGPERRPQVY